MTRIGHWWSHHHMLDTWFSDWFNEDYLKVYQHRDESEAKSLVDLIKARTPEVKFGLTLDLACGAGRHLSYLRSQQKTVGLDLSPWLLHEARRHDQAAQLVRADMRSLPFRNGAFSLVANLFTSFGYFSDDAQSARVLKEVARITRQHGWLVLDFLNATHARHSFVPFDHKQVGEVKIDQRRRVTPSGRFVIKNIRLSDEPQEFVERVRLFEPWELVEMLRVAGLTVRYVFGDYSGQPLSEESQRAIIFAQKLP